MREHKKASTRRKNEAKQREENLKWSGCVLVSVSHFVYTPDIAPHHLDDLFFLQTNGGDHDTSNALAIKSLTCKLQESV
jgi:hypothetical protein